jgi:FlaA1/EpsC-like NDP-sugar epimerase
MRRVMPHIDGDRVATMAAHVRGRHLFALDAIGVVFGAYFCLAVCVPGSENPATFVAYLPVVAILLVSRSLTDVRCGLYRQAWRFASVPDLGRIGTAVAVGSVASLGVVYGAASATGTSIAVGIPVSFWMMEALVAVVFLGAPRYAIRALADLGRQPVAQASNDDRRTLLYGAGRMGVQVVRLARHRPGSGVVPVGFLDDDPHLAGTRVAGLPVYGGLEALQHAAGATGAQSVLITMPSAPGPAVRRVVDGVMALGLQVRTIPSMIDLLDGRRDADNIRSVRVEDLLGRPLATEHETDIASLISDQTILITGAGGSIGSELARQVHAMHPRRLVLVDRAESALYLIQRELETRDKNDGPDGELRLVLANVVSTVAMQRLISTERPSVILHAAAYKHVPMMEDHPSDAVYVNVIGTQVVVDAAAEAGVERFVLVSTDKAVQPSSIMGASKRIAEMLVADVARRTGRPYVSVRFGNVLGSAGSVLPILRQQLENGRPLTITHPDMTRYFMTIPEAAWLILDALALGQSGDLFALDMGEPIRIMDLARDLVRLAGRDPDTQPMEFIGLRPGEKLHEQLFYDAERVEQTSTAKVLRAISSPPPLGIRDDVQRLVELSSGDRETDLRLAIMALVQAEASPVVEDEGRPEGLDRLIARVVGGSGVGQGFVAPPARAGPS